MKKPQVAPTRRLGAWFAASSLGLFIQPLLHGAVWLTAGADVLLLFLVLADLQALRGADGLRLRRSREPILSLGVANAVRLELENPTPQTFQVEVNDEAPPPFRTEGESFQLVLSGNRAWEGTYRTIPGKRGDYEFGGLNLRSRTPLGLVASYRRLEPQPRAVRVYPNLRDMKNLTLLGMQDQWMRMGIRRKRAPQVGREFESLRDYRPGDEWRTLDWKATARRSQLTTRQYDVERSQKILLVLDLGRTMSSRLGDVTKADLAINACVLLTAVAARLDDRVGVMAFADRLLGFFPPGRGKQQPARLLEFLYPLEAVQRESDYRMAFADIVTRIRSRTLVVVFTDLVDAESSSQLIRQLAVLATRHAVLCVALADYELDKLLEQRPRGADDLYRQAVAYTLLEDRDYAAARLTERGVAVMKANPDQLSVQVVNRYLSWKTSGSLRAPKVT